MPHPVDIDIRFVIGHNRWSEFLLSCYVL